MNANSIILRTPSIEIMNKEEIIQILFWAGEGPMIFHSDKTIYWKTLLTIKAVQKYKS